MILLDTNVISEVMRPIPAPQVIAWLDRHTAAGYAISVVTKAEILLGIALLPAGKRRDTLAALAELTFCNDFSGRIYSFDENVANVYVKIIVERRQQGLTTSTEDAQIAATAMYYGYSLATRNIKDFVGISELILINPWTDC